VLASELEYISGRSKPYLAASLEEASAAIEGELENEEREGADERSEREDRER